MSGDPNVSNSGRGRLRDLFPHVDLGAWRPGPKNGITDVPGVLAHTVTIRDETQGVNTGATTLLPRRDWFYQASYAGIFRFNGSGEMTGSHWIEETGLLHSPLIITNSFSVGACYTGIYQFAIKNIRQGSDTNWFLLPVVAETFDGYLNDLTRSAVTPDHIEESLKKASADPVPEGNVGGGTGMLCHGFKGGTGTSSRLVPTASSQTYTVGVLVQANYGKMQHLRISGVPVGKVLASQIQKNTKAQEILGNEEKIKDGSIIIIIATDAPLHPTQLSRLAKRATVGLSRVGGYGHTQSGDIFLAFSTASKIPVQGAANSSSKVQPDNANTVGWSVIDDQTINALFEATADATEEAIYNALCMAETMTGQKNRTVEALPLDRVGTILKKADVFATGDSA